MGQAMTNSLITFDLYSALADIEQSLLPEVERLLPAAEPAALIRTWRVRQLEYTLFSTLLSRGHLSFREITAKALDCALRQHDLELSKTARVGLVGAWTRLGPWPEAGEVLVELSRRGHTLALLSNGDEVMLRAQAPRFGVSFDHVFAADQAGVYKPHPAIYRLPLEALGLAPEEVLHVAGSGRDVIGAKAAGLRCYWSNRMGETLLEPTLAPDYEHPDLHGLLIV
jgi:2-haloacid dehalogenase